MELLVILIIAIALVPTIWAIVDIVQRPADQFPRYATAGDGDRKGWIIALIVGWILGLGWLVAIVYLLVVRAKMGPVAKPESPPAPPQPPAGS